MKDPTNSTSRIETTFAAIKISTKSTLQALDPTADLFLVRLSTESYCQAERVIKNLFQIEYLVLTFVCTTFEINYHKLPSALGTGRTKPMTFKVSDKKNFITTNNKRTRPLTMEKCQVSFLENRSISPQSTTTHVLIGTRLTQTVTSSDHNTIDIMQYHFSRIWMCLQKLLPYPVSWNWTRVILI